jgi:hypothetical protein
MLQLAIRRKRRPPSTVGLFFYKSVEMVGTEKDLRRSAALKSSPMPKRRKVKQSL